MFRKPKLTVQVMRKSFGSCNGTAYTFVDSTTDASGAAIVPKMIPVYLRKPNNSKLKVMCNMVAGTTNDTITQVDKWIAAEVARVYPTT